MRGAKGAEEDVSLDIKGSRKPLTFDPRLKTESEGHAGKSVASVALVALAPSASRCFWPATNHRKPYSSQAPFTLSEGAVFTSYAVSLDAAQLNCGTGRIHAPSQRLKPGAWLFADDLSCGPSLHPTADISMRPRLLHPGGPPLPLTSMCLSCSWPSLAGN
jgi:hypothetical protein